MFRLNHSAMAESTTMFDLDSQLNQAFMSSAEDETFTNVMTAVIENGDSGSPGPTHMTITETADLISRSKGALAFITHLTLHTPDSIFMSNSAWVSHMDHLGRQIRDNMPNLRSVTIVKVASLGVLCQILNNAPRLDHIDMRSAFPVISSHIHLLAATPRIESVHLNMYEAKGMRSPSASFASWSAQHNMALNSIELFNCMHMRSGDHSNLFRIRSLRKLSMHAHRINTLPKEIAEQWDFAKSDAPYQVCAEDPFKNTFNILLERIDDGFIPGIAFLAPTLSDIRESLKTEK